jgi:hypothetical protein
MIFLEKQVNCRLRLIEWEQLNSIVENNKDRFSDPSHFVRCAVIEKIRKER